MNEWAVSAQRRAVLEAVAAAVLVLRSADAVRVAVDGVDGAGKTVFADQLADVLTLEGRPVIRASVDDFHRPRAERYRRGQDSPVGFWLDSYDYDRLRADLLDPLSPGGDGSYRSKAHHLASDRQVDEPARPCPPGAVLLVDGVFLHREELRAYWDFSIWLEVGFEVSAARMADRDGTSADPDHPSLARYIGGQRLYLAECQPARRADVVIDNTDPEHPVALSA
ncbi:MAG: nucleoside/nucleotide kinase family protein [Mycobacteriales bacterium]